MNSEPDCLVKLIVSMTVDIMYKRLVQERWKGLEEKKEEMLELKSLLSHSSPVIESPENLTFNSTSSPVF